MRVREDSSNIWYCHCCSAGNTNELKKCRVCGRADSYVLQGYPLPLHGKSVLLFRPSQAVNVLENLHEIDSEGWTALHSACVNGSVDMAKELLKLDSIVNAATDKGQTPLHLAVYAGSFEIVKELINFNANVNLKTYFEELTPLHLACSGGWKQICKFLIENGAKVNDKTKMERTPLHCVIPTGRSDIVVILLKSKAKHDAMDIHGWTPRQIAELHGHREIQELLVRVGMPEKQSVIKVLPVAPWHSELWDDVIHTQKQRILEAEQEKKKWEDLKVELVIVSEKEHEIRLKVAEKNRVKVLLERANDANANVNENSPVKKHKLKNPQVTPESTDLSSLIKLPYNRPPPLSLLGYDNSSKLIRKSVEDKIQIKHTRRNIFPLQNFTPEPIDSITHSSENLKIIDIKKSNDLSFSAREIYSPSFPRGIPGIIPDLKKLSGITASTGGAAPLASTPGVGNTFRKERDSFLLSTGRSSRTSGLSLRAETTGKLLNLTQQNIALIRENDISSGMPIFGGGLNANNNYPKSVFVQSSNAGNRESSISTLTEEMFSEINADQDENQSVT